MNKLTKNGLLSLVALIGLTSSVAVVTKADLGVDAYTSVQLTLANLSGIEMGTISLFLNLVMVAGQVFLLRNAFPKRQYFQLAVAVVGGVVINFVLYQVLGNIDISHNYPLRLAICVLFNIVLGVIIALILSLNFVRLPLEGLCLTISEVFPNISFFFMRQAVDVVSLLFSFIVSYLVFGFDLDKMPVREGTVLSMLMLPKIIDLAYRHFQKQHWIQQLKIS